MFNRKFLEMIATTMAIGFYRSCERTDQWPSVPEIEEVARLFEAATRELVTKRQQANRGGMRRFKVIRIHVIEAPSKAAAWRWLREATPDALEQTLDFQTVKEVEEGGWLRAVVKQVTGK